MTTDPWPSHKKDLRRSRPGACVPRGLRNNSGTLCQSRTPAYSGANFISITEYPRPNAVVRAPRTVRFASNGQALLQQERATLKTRGCYLIIDAGSPAAAISAAQAFR